MILKTRLDRVVNLRENAVEQAEQALAAARRALETERAALEEAVRAALTDHRVACDASELHLVEAGHVRALRDIRTQEQQLRVQAASEEKARVALTKMQMDVEVVRRAADRKREELTKAASRQENKQLDGLANLLFAFR